MKKTLLTNLFILPYFLFSQMTAETNRSVGKVKIPTMTERYKIDYELVDESIIANDSLALETIPVDFPDDHRKKTEDVIVFNPEGTFQIRIYSLDRATNNKH